MDVNVEDVSNIQTQFNDCVSRLEDDSIWSGSSKEQLLDSMDEIGSDFLGKISEQLSLLSKALELYQTYQMKCDRLNSLYFAVQDDSLDDDTKASYYSEITQLEDEIKSLRESIINLLSAIKGLQISGAVAPAGSNGNAKGKFTYYNQQDYDDKYGKYTIAEAGCGPTSMAMILTYLTGEEVTPIEAAEWSEEHKYVNGGTYFGYFSAISDEYGLDYTEYTESSGDRITEEAICEHLRNGEKIIIHMGPGTFTNQGHYIVLTGINDDGKITIADPYTEKFNDRTWDPSVFVNQNKGNMICFET